MNKSRWASSAVAFQVLAAAITVSGFCGQALDRKRISINPGWRFHLGEPEQEPVAVDFDDSAWEQISVPHTLRLTSLALDRCEDDKAQPTFHRDIAWYRRAIVVSANPGKVFLEFEGARGVWLSGFELQQAR